MAKGRQPGVLVFGFKGFLEGVVRTNEGLPFDKEPTVAQKASVEKKVSDLREAMKLEKSADIKITGDAPHTKEVVSLFLTQMRATFVETESTGSLKEQLLTERMERESLQKRLEEMEAQLARATSGKKKTG